MPDVGGLDVSVITGQSGAVAVPFRSATVAVEEHVGLVHAAAADVDKTTLALNRAVDRSSLLAIGRIAILVGTSILFALGLGSAIGKPLRRLAQGAQNLRDGAEAGPLSPSGPTEIREAMLAINEAGAHIELAERQAQALADGELDHGALTESAPGALGQSLQEAVQTLTGSLNERESFRRRLAHEATHDSLTQVANRKASLTHLEESLARTGRSGATLAVLFIDLDGFKEVNDQHGHPAGDAVLWALGKRISQAVRAGDHVGRLGGDEFLIIAEPVEGAGEALALAKRVADEASKPMAVGETTVVVTLSIGVAVSEPLTGLTATELLHDADLAVYRAKELGRARIELCNEELRQELANRADIEEALRHATTNDELSMHYQPILDAHTAELVSLEALLRWDRPGIGRIPPDLFIPIAERSDLITEIDKWVVRHVVQQLDQWTTNTHLKDVTIAINISSRHLASDNFVTDILDPVLHGEIDPTRIVLEVTESALLHDLDSAAHKLQTLREQGLRIAIDDFGTGYTSLGHLRSLPLDILKIDRTFINDESAISLVKLIIDIGHLLGATITAEGIETAEQAAHLTQLGSDTLQGYLFARPMPAADVEHELTRTTTQQTAFIT